MKDLLISPLPEQYNLHLTYPKLFPQWLVSLPVNPIESNVSPDTFAACDEAPSDKLYITRPKLPGATLLQAYTA